MQCDLVILPSVDKQCTINRNRFQQTLSFKDRKSIFSCLISIQIYFLYYPKSMQYLVVFSSLAQCKIEISFIRLLNIENRHLADWRKLIDRKDSFLFKQKSNFFFFFFDWYVNFLVWAIFNIFMYFYASPKVCNIQHDFSCSIKVGKTVY